MAAPDKLQELVETSFKESRWQQKLTEYSLLINKLEEVISEKITSISELNDGSRQELIEKNKLTEHRHLQR